MERNLIAKLRNIQDYINNTDNFNRKWELIELREEILKEHIEKNGGDRTSILCEVYK